MRKGRWQKLLGIFAILGMLASFTPAIATAGAPSGYMPATSSGAATTGMLGTQVIDAERIQAPTGTRRRRIRSIFGTVLGGGRRLFEGVVLITSRLLYRFRGSQVKDYTNVTQQQATGRASPHYHRHGWTQILSSIIGISRAGPRQHGRTAFAYNNFATTREMRFQHGNTVMTTTQQHGTDTNTETTTGKRKEARPFLASLVRFLSQLGLQRHPVTTQRVFSPA